MEVKIDKIDDLQGQRNFLINKVISAQRLALDRCHFSYQFAKEKCWVRFVLNTRVSNKKIYDKNFNENKDLMAEAKARIKFLEEQNRIITEENDDLKQGAIDSVKIMESAEMLQKETEVMSLELADKAI